MPAPVSVAAVHPVPSLCEEVSAMAHCNPAACAGLDPAGGEQGSLGSLTCLGFPLGEAFCESHASHGGVTGAGADGAVVIVLFSTHVLKQLKITLEMMAQSMKNVLLALRKSPATLVATRLCWFCHICSGWGRSLDWSCGMKNLSYLISSLLWQH